MYNVKVYAREYRKRSWLTNKQTKNKTKNKTKLWAASKKQWKTKTFSPINIYQELYPKSKHKYLDLSFLKRSSAPNV